MICMVARRTRAAVKPEEMPYANSMPARMPPTRVNGALMINGSLNPVRASAINQRSQRKGCEAAD